MGRGTVSARAGRGGGKWRGCLCRLLLTEEHIDKFRHSFGSTLADVLQKQQGKYILGSSGTGSKQVRLLLNHEQKKQQTPAGDAAEEK